MIRLRHQEGYYSREVVVGGSRFRIRELDDEALDQVQEVEAEIRSVMEELGLGPDEAARIAAAGAVDEAATQTAELAAKLANAPVKALRRLRELQKRRRDLICRAGVVGWEIPDTPYQPELIPHLPEWVKAALAREILQDTLMPEATADFLAQSPEQ